MSEFEEIATNALDRYMASLREEIEEALVEAARDGHDHVELIQPEPASLARSEPTEIKRPRIRVCDHEDRTRGGARITRWDLRDVVEISFDRWEYVEEIIDGEKWSTIRYAFTAPIDPGDPVFLLTPDGERFAMATVLDMLEAPAEFLAAITIPGHRQYKNTRRLVSRLGQYYPEATLGPESMFTVIWFDVLEVLR